MMAGTLDSERTATLAAYVELAKPGITAMVAMTAAAGFLMGATSPLDVAAMAVTVVGVALSAAGTSALNMYLERDTDARMPRTQNRPIPSGRIAPGAALAYGAALWLAGLAALTAAAEPAATLSCALAGIIYVFIYTPLKSVTSLSTLVGAISGALPPVVGWLAACGEISAGALILFSILFFWQIPHFLAIAWIYRTQYASAGLSMLPVEDASGDSTARQALLHNLALLGATLAPGMLGMSGPGYLAGALALGMALLLVAAAFAVRRTEPWGRRLFLSSTAYLPILLTLLVVDRFSTG